MSENVLEFMTLIAAVSAFGLVVSIWFMAMLLWRVRRSSYEERMANRLKIRQRSGVETSRVLSLWRDGKSFTTTVSDVRISLWARLEQGRRTLGFRLPLSALILGFLSAVLLVVLLILTLTMNPVLAAIGGAFGIILPWMYIRRKLDQNIQLFESQFADALGLATRSLRAGQPLLGAFRLIVEEMEAPVGALFAEICQQQSLGVPLDEALRSAAEQSHSTDMKLFAASTAIQLHSGGNLADMMERLSDVIRDRIRLRRRARILTAQTQLSKRVLIAIPFGILGILYVINGAYLTPLYETNVGRLLLGIAGLCLLLGSWVMNRIATLRY